MSYEYKDEILDDIGPEPNYNYQIDSDRYYAKLKELDENYTKAEAFDEIKGIAFWYFERMHPNFENSAEYESFYEDIRNELKEIESGAK